MNHRFLFLLVCTCIFLKSYGQTFNETDSLRHELSIVHEDTTKVLLMREMAIALEYTYPDSAMNYANDALNLSREIKYSRGEAYALNEIGSILFLTGNYSMALEKFLSSLQIREALQDKHGIAVASCNIGLVYLEQNDYRAALNYFFKAKKIDEETNSEIGIMIDYNDIGDAYERMNLLDSALYFQNIAYQKALSIHDEEYIGPILTSLGNVQLKLKNYDLSLSYFKTSLPYAEKIRDLQNFSETYLGISNLYRSKNMNDSSAFYAKKAIAAAMGSYPIGVLEASNLLADIYIENHLSDSAIIYMQMAEAMNDTLFNQEKTRQLQTLTLNEQMRQQEIAQQKIREEEIRKHNLQNIGIIIFIITLFIAVMYLSRRHVPPKIVEFLGLLSLLLFFEFIYMFVYPWIAVKTNDIPVLVLVCSVIAASILVPIHKKIERWVKRKLAERRQA